MRKSFNKLTCVKNYERKRALSVKESVYVRTIAITGSLDRFTRIYGFEEQKRDNDIKFYSKIYSKIIIHSKTICRIKFK